MRFAFVALITYVLFTASFALHAADPEIRKERERIAGDFPLEETKAASPELLKALASFADSYPKSSAVIALYRDYFGSLRRMEFKGEISEANGEAIRLVEA